jgi:serine/threonine protein kinase
MGSLSGGAGNPHSGGFWGVPMPVQGKLQMASGTPGVSLETFAAKLAASQLIPSEKWPETKTNVLAAADAKTAALKLASQGLLSRWQASQLLRGNTSLTLGRYRLIEQIGQSVFGKIYVAEHAQLARKLTLFAFAPRLLRGEVREGLMAKARSAAGLDHSAILRVSDIDHEGEQYYFISPEITVTDVAGYVAKNGSLPGSKAAALTAAIAEALAFGAQNQVSHGWLCPSNVVLDAKGHPFVVGFGFADVIANHPEVESQLVAEATEAERLSIPPESEGTIAPSPSVDAYALGQLLFLLATGKSPARDELGDPDAREQIQTANPSILPAIADLYAELTNADVSQRLTGASLIADRLKEIAIAEAPTLTAPPPLAASQSVPIIKAKKAKPLPRATSVAKATAAVVTGPSLDSDELRLAEVESVSAPSFPSVDISALQKTDSSLESKSAASEPRKDDSHHHRRRKGSSKAAVWVTVAAGGSLVFLIGVTAFVLWLVMPPGNSAQVAKNNAKGNVAPANNAASSSATANQAPKSDAKQPETPATGDKPKDTSEVAAPPQQVASPDANASQSSDTTPAPDPAMAKPEEPANPNPSPDPAATPPAPPTTEPSPSPPATPDPAPPMPPTDQGPPGGPLAKLPAIFELESPSEANASKPIDMGELPLAANAFATAMLVGGDAAVKGQYQFSLEDKADNDWNVKLTAIKEKTEKVIANLAVAEGKLKFTWTNEAASEPNAAGLKNCILSFSAAGSAPHKMILRTPVEFDTIAPNEKKLSVNKQIELANLPSPDRLRLQIVPAGAGMPNPDVSYTTKMTGAKSKYGEPKSENEIRPAVLWIGLSPQVKPFGFEVKPEVKGKGLTVAVQTVVRTPKDLDEQNYFNYVTKQVQNASKTKTTQLQVATGELERLKGAQPVPGEDPNAFNVAKEENLRLLTSQVATLTGTALWLSDADKLAPAALQGSSIEFRLYYDAGESMQVDIARSKGFPAKK